MRWRLLVLMLSFFFGITPLDVSAGDWLLRVREEVRTPSPSEEDAESQEKKKETKKEKKENKNASSGYSASKLCDDDQNGSNGNYLVDALAFYGVVATSPFWGPNCIV